MIASREEEPEPDRTTLRAFVRDTLTGAWSIVAMGIFVAAALIAVLGFELWREYREIEAQAFRETRNLAAVLDEHVARSMFAAEEVLQALAARALAASRDGTIDTAPLESELMLLPKGLPQIEALSILDASGHVVISTLPDLQRGIDLSDTEAYRRAAAGSSRGASYIGPLVQGRQTARWIIPMSRGVYDVSGRLLGVAIVTINPEAFVSLFDVLDIGRFSAVTLMQRDGVIVARAPDQTKFVGRTVAGGELDRRVNSQSPQGSVRIKGVLFGRDLFMSYLAVDRTPFIINVAYDANQVLLPWTRLVEFYGTLGFALLAAIATCVWLVRRDQARQTKIATGEQVHDIIEGMSTHVALLELDGTVTEVNRALLDAANLTRADVIGKRLWNTFWYAYSVENQKRIRDTLERAASDEVMRSDLTFRVGKDAFAQIDTTFQAIRKPGDEVKRIIVSGVDVTERRRLEQQLGQSQKMEAIGLLAGGIAHDFNNLLGVIANFAQFLTEDLKERKTEQSYAMRIAKACERGKQVVAQLFAYARPTTALRSSTELRTVLAEVETMVRTSMQPPASLIVDLGRDPVIVTANEAQLTQIFINLCLNAYDALPGRNGVVRLSLSIARQFDPDHPARNANSPGDPAIATCRTGVGDATKPYALVTISDTGSGMDAATLKHVFEPFYTTKAHGQGTGLGLSVVDSIVQSLGGVCSVESRVGQGSNFSIYLPLDEFAVPATKSNAAATEHRAPRGLRVLIVDDDLAVADTLAIALDRMGYEATVLDDPLEARAAFTTNPDAWNVIITDEHMPTMRGSDLIADMKAVRPHLTIILCSGSASVSEAMALSWGADAYIPKPVAPSRLAAAIDALASA